MKTSIGIVGLGLLGGSLAEALRRCNPALKIAGISSPQTLLEAQEKRLIDKAYDYSQIDRVLNEVDFLILCTPIGQISQTLSRWITQTPRLEKAVLVTDVGSTKTSLCALGQQIHEKQPLFQWVGSHPMAGSEKRGLTARSPHLFENAPWIFCPSNSEEEKFSSYWEMLVRSLGSLPLRLHPSVHDVAVARISHLPQLLATTLAGYFNQVDQHKTESLNIIGRGFRDMTRLSKSSLPVWEPIFQTNHENILQELYGFQSYLTQVIKNFEAQNYKPFFQQGNSLEIPPINSPLSVPGEPTEIRVSCPDLPGQLALILSPLSARGINIQDVEMLKNRENEPGTIRLILGSPQEAKDSINILNSLKFDARYP